MRVESGVGRAARRDDAGAGPRSERLPIGLCRAFDWLAAKGERAICFRNGRTFNGRVSPILLTPLCRLLLWDLPLDTVDFWL